MRIKTLEFEDKTRGWKLSETHFDQLTLLVGASGVGKTQILRAIDTLKRISEGESFTGVSWRMNFETTDRGQYLWEGEFEIRNKDDEFSTKIRKELIEQGSESLVNRDGEKVLFNGSQTIKLSRERSIVNLIEEDFAKEIRSSFRDISFSDFSRGNLSELNPFQDFDFYELDDFPTLDSLIHSPLTGFKRLSFAYHANFPVVEKIFDRFYEVFPTVEKIKFASENPESEDGTVYPPGLHDLFIKEYNVDEWIEQRNISSGMLRTLAHLSEIYLSPPGSVFLIDEFENSLGINCINELTTDMLNADRSLQFIITSHHPYIINAIDFSHWKVVTRSGGVVKTLNATELNLGRSKHEAFMQLLQRPEYQTGTESERV